jgi:uncharacterized glyoxalase superfamily protein PhnB
VTWRAKRRRRVDGERCEQAPRRPRSAQQLYVPVDGPDAHHRRARAAGAEIVLEPTDTAFGARVYSAHDLEGHLWTFGTYQVGADVRVEHRAGPSACSGPTN